MIKFSHCILLLVTVLTITNTITVYLFFRPIPETSIKLSFPSAGSLPVPATPKILSSRTSGPHLHRRYHSNSVDLFAASTIPIYWINLDRSVDRRKQMEAMFSMPKLTGWNNTRISAANVKGVQAKLDDGTLFVAAKICQEKCELWTPGRITMKEVAVSLSHINAIKEAYERGDPMALILEDDVVIQDDFLDSWKEYLRTAPLNWNVLQMLTNNYRDVLPYLSKISQDGFVPWFPEHWSTGAYLINRAGMQNILDATMFKDEMKNQVIVRMADRKLVTLADELMYMASGKAYTAVHPFFIPRANVISTVQVNIKGKDILDSHGLAHHLILGMRKKRNVANFTSNQNFLLMESSIKKKEKEEEEGEGEEEEEEVGEEKDIEFKKKERERERAAAMIDHGRHYDHHNHQQHVGEIISGVESLLILIVARIQASVQIQGRVDTFCNNAREMTRIFGDRAHFNIHIVSTSNKLKEQFRVDWKESCRDMMNDRIEIIHHIYSSVFNKFRLFAGYPVTNANGMEYPWQTLNGMKFRNHKYVMLLDEDIEMCGFPWQEYFRRVDVSQSPVTSAIREIIEENMRTTKSTTKIRTSFPFQNGRFWKTNRIQGDPNNFHMEMIKTDFLEMFFITFTGEFAEYFFSKIDPILNENKVISSWGPDVVWCGASKEFIQLRKITTGGGAASTPAAPCTLITLLLVDQNTMTLSQSTTHKTKQKAGHSALSIYKEKFPEWYMHSNIFRAKWDGRMKKSFVVRSDAFTFPECNKCHDGKTCNCQYKNAKTCEKERSRSWMVVVGCCYQCCCSDKFLWT